MFPNINNNKPSNEEVKKAIKLNNKASLDIEVKLLKIAYPIAKFPEGSLKMQAHLKTLEYIAH